MKIYYLPIEVAFITFPIIILLAIFPYMIVQYHKYGSISLLKTLILGLFVLYVLTAYYLVILPLPDPKMVANLHSKTMQVIPLHFMYDLITKSIFDIHNPSTILPALSQNVMIQPIFNIFLTIPFGIFLSYYYKQSIKKVILFSFILSLFFELTQLSGLYTIYPRPYRLFDIDDLFLNTIGGLIGYHIFNLVKNILPSKDSLNTKSLLRSNKISYLRRLNAFIIDIIIVNIIAIIINIITIIILNKAIVDYIDSLILFIIYYYLYFIITQLIFNNTIGKRLVRIKPKFTNNKLISLLIKYTLIIIVMPFGLLYEITNNYHINAFIYLIILILFIINIIYKSFKDKILFYESLSKIININNIIEPNNIK